MNSPSDNTKLEGLEFFTDSNGNPCARGEDERIAVYLQSDIQGSEGIARELLQRLGDPDSRGDFSGNAHTVEIRESTVRIEALFDDEAPDRCLPRGAMQDILNAWLKFICQS